MTTLTCDPDASREEIQAKISELERIVTERQWTDEMCFRMGNLAGCDNARYDIIRYRNEITKLKRQLEKTASTVGNKNNTSNANSVT